MALGLRALCVIALSAAPAWDGVIYERAAAQLSRGEGYTQRILDETAEAKPTAFFPPGYPALLSLLHRQVGGRSLDPWLQTLASSGLVPAAWLLGRRLAGMRAGRIAAWLIALWPGGILLSASWFTEPIFAVLAALSLLPVLYARRRARRRGLLWAAWLLGCAAYVRPTALVMAPLLGAAAGWLTSAPPLSRRVGTAGRWAVLALALSSVPLSPWVLRNQLALGAPVLVSTNGGFNLLLGSFGEGSFGDLEPRLDCPSGMREVALDRCRRERALTRIASDPLAWLARGVLKVVHTVGHDSAPAQLLSANMHKTDVRAQRIQLLALALCRAFWLPFFALALAGALFVTRERSLHPPGLLLAVPIASLLLLHFVYIGGDRYHAPLAPSFAALAALAVVRIFKSKPRADRVIT